MINSKDILDEVRNNRKKLDGCIRHDFSIDLTPDKPFFKKYECTQCHGQVDSINKSWYEKGLSHSGGGQ